MGRSFQGCGVWILFRHSYFLVLAQFAIARAQANKKQHHVHFASLNSLYLNGPIFVFNPSYSRQHHIEIMLIRAFIEWSHIRNSPKASTFSSKIMLTVSYASTPHSFYLNGHAIESHHSH